MITLYAFGRIFPAGVGETKDLRAQWALEETGLPYRVHALDHTGGDAVKHAKHYRDAVVPAMKRAQKLGAKVITFDADSNPARCGC